jgi:hypothetical protein
MLREKKTEAQLVTLIKASLKGYRECSSVNIHLTKGDAIGEGANWTVSVAQAGRRVSPCYSRVVEISRGLAKKFDLAD